MREREVKMDKDTKADATYFCNRDCRYFPCHPVGEDGFFNCLFCYCPLYALGEACGGTFHYTQDGLKDCSACAIPHLPGGYKFVMGRMPNVMEQARKKG